MKHYRMIAVLAVVVVVGIALTAIPTTEEAQYGGTLVIALEASIPAIDWMTSLSKHSRIIGFHVWEGLVVYGGDFDIIPQLAESWEANDDYSVWTFHLRKGVLFHDGTQMTAEDVLASYERFMKVSLRKNDFSRVEEVSILDPYTVQFKCSSSTRLLDILANPVLFYVMPKRLKDVGMGELAIKDCIGTGPFRLAEWLPGQYVRLVRFEDYVPSDFPASGFGGKRIAYVDEVLFKPVAETGARVAGIETGAYDLITSLPYEDRDRFNDDPRFVVQQLELPYMWPCLILNTTKWPFSDVRMRQAVMAALDQDEIMDVVGHGNKAFYRVDPSFFMKPSKWYSDIGARLGLYNQCDPEKAKHLMEEAGYNGEPISIITSHDFDSIYRASMVTASQLQKVGFNVQMEIYDWAGASAIQFQKRGLQDWDIGYTGHTPRMDPSINYAIWYGPNEYTGFRNDEVDSLIEKDMGTFEFEERYKLWEEIQKILYEIAAPEIKHGDVFSLHAWKTEVKGYHPWYMPVAWNVWLDR